MKKKIFCLFVIFNFLFLNILNAEAKEVPKTSKEQPTINKKKWEPWAVAIATILIAAAGLIIVSKHKGKKT